MWPERLWKTSRRYTESLLEYSHADNIVAGIDVNILSGDSGGQIGAQKGAHITDLFDSYITPQWCVARNFIEYFLETANARRGQGFDRAR